MTAAPLAVLLVEDNPDDELLIRRELRKGGLDARLARVDTPAGLAAALDRDDWQLVIADYNLPAFSGMEALAEVKRRRPGLPLILVSGTVGEDVAVDSIKAGADDYLLKQNLVRLVPAVVRAIREAGERAGRAAAERDLGESRGQLALIFHTVSDFLAYLTRGPDGRWVYAKANRAFAATLAPPGPALDPAALRGRDAEAAERDVLRLDPAARDWLAARRAEAVAAGRPLRAEWAFRPPGRAFVAEVTFIPVVDPDGAVRRLLIDGRDVTDLRRTEERERKARELVTQAQKMEALGTLSGGLAHDFNNLITGIRGFADLADTAADLTEVRTYTTQIRAVADRARGLVRQLLTFSRRQPAAREVVAVAPLVRELIPLVAASVPAGVAVTADAPDPGPHVVADPGQLHQVLVNLCTNAGHAMPDGGRLTVSAGVAELGAEFCLAHPPLAPGLHARVAVADTGTGMTPEVARRAFEPFFTTKPAGSGTGLGLSVVHGIVRDHGGALEVTTAVGAGTTIAVYLPLAPARPPTAAAAPGRGERVVVVDDNAAITDLTVRQLADLGYRPTGFTDPTAAAAAVAADPAGVDVLLTDLRMQKLSGLALAAAVRGRRPGLPVVLASGSGELGGAAPPGAVLLAKPFTREQLAAALARALGRGT